jgi:MraZ protein
MFLGQYRHSLDNKGRLTIPARFRELLEGGAFVTRGFDHNLLILTTADFDRLTRRVNQMSMTDPDARDLRRRLFSNASQVDFDRLGRILIPTFLREAAQIDGDAFLVGAGNYFEIWAPEVWEKHNARQEEDEDTRRFTAFDIHLGE